MAAVENEKATRPSSYRQPHSWLRAAAPQVSDKNLRASRLIPSVPGEHPMLPPSKKGLAGLSIPKTYRPTGNMLLLCLSGLNV